MGKTKGVSLIVDEGFFRNFEKDREREQTRLRKKMGLMFNLSQRSFTAMLAKEDFRFKVPRGGRIIRRKRRR